MKSLNFRDFMNLLKTCEELHSVAVEVDPDLEIAAITARVCKSRQNRALLFDSVKGSSFRVVTNLFGSELRLSLALGLENLSALTDRFDSILANLQGVTAAEKLAALATSPDWSAATPLLCDHPADLHETAIDLSILPVIKKSSSRRSARA